MHTSVCDEDEDVRDLQHYVVVFPVVDPRIGFSVTKYYQNRARLHQDRSTYAIYE